MRRKSATTVEELADRLNLEPEHVPLLRLAGKKIVVYPYGSDARLASSTRALGRWNAYTDVPVGNELPRAHAGAVGHSRGKVRRLLEGPQWRHLLNYHAQHDEQVS